MLLLSDGVRPLSDGVGPLAELEHSTMECPILSLNFVDPLIFNETLRLNFIPFVVVYFLDIAAYALKSFETVVD
jgi:hypothetical protein